MVLVAASGVATLKRLWRRAIVSTSTAGHERAFCELVNIVAGGGLGLRTRKSPNKRLRLVTRLTLGIPSGPGIEFITPLGIPGRRKNGRLTKLLPLPLRTSRRAELGFGSLAPIAAGASGKFTYLRENIIFGAESATT